MPFRASSGRLNEVLLLDAVLPERPVEGARPDETEVRREDGPELSAPVSEKGSISLAVILLRSRSGMSLGYYFIV
jgi:hypothetical protein